MKNVYQKAKWWKFDEGGQNWRERGRETKIFIPLAFFIIHYFKNSIFLIERSWKSRCPEVYHTEKNKKIDVVPTLNKRTWLSTSRECTVFWKVWYTTGGMYGFIVSFIHSGVVLYPECKLWFHKFVHPMVIEAQFFFKQISIF